MFVADIVKALAKWIVGWLWRWMRPDTSRTALNRYDDDLADAVVDREAGLLEQLSGGPHLVVGDLEFRAELRLRLAADDAAGVLADIGPYFRRRETRRLVVLGKAGAGKTVTVAHLVLDQLNHRKTLTDAERADEPVPVRVNAAGWDGSTDFTTWLANQLATDYGLNPRVARALVDTARILPVLDGLDEMDAPRAQPMLGRAALDRLNKPPWRNRAVVVACRSRVYDAIRELGDDAGLQFATTVILQPLSTEDIYIYLEQYRDEYRQAETNWAPITDQLQDQPDGTLATALGTPWLLSLAAMAVKRGGRSTATKLAACRDSAEVRDLLFGTLIPAAVDGTPDTKHTRSYTEENVQRWLRTLAGHLEQRRIQHFGGSQVALDQIWQLAGTRKCRAVHAVLGALIWLAVGPALTLSLGSVGAHNSIGEDLRYGLVCGIAAGILTGLWYALTPVRAESAPQRSRSAGRFARRGSAISKRFAWRVPGHSRWRRGLKRAIIVGFPTGFLPLVVLVTGGLDRVALGLVASVFSLALVFGLVAGLGTTSEERLALGQDASRIVHDDLMSVLMGGLVWLVTFVTTISLVSVLETAVNPDFFGTRFPTGETWRYWYGDTLLLPLFVGLLLTLLSASLSAVASGRYATASLLFAITGKFPRRPARFLEWARNSGLLRVTGIAYQFRHDTYQQWLAGRERDRDVSKSSGAPADARSS